ncbi:MAG: hypothetical protein WCS73_01560 [Lentisphaeria bacterium]
MRIILALIVTACLTQAYAQPAITEDSLIEETCREFLPPAPSASMKKGIRRGERIAENDLLCLNDQQLPPPPEGEDGLEEMPAPKNMPGRGEMKDGKGVRRGRQNQKDMRGEPGGAPGEKGMRGSEDSDNELGEKPLSGRFLAILKTLKKENIEKYNELLEMHLENRQEFFKEMRKLMPKDKQHEFFDKLRTAKKNAMVLARKYKGMEDSKEKEDVLQELKDQIAVTHKMVVENMKQRITDMQKKMTDMESSYDEMQKRTLEMLLNPKEGPKEGQKAGPKEDGKRNQKRSQNPQK